MKRKLLLALTLGFVSIVSTAYSQEGDLTEKSLLNPIVTGVPSLTIAPDARGGGMGDIGAATSPDVNSQYWNPAKYAFMKSGVGVSLSYTPWLRKLVNDISLSYLSGYYKFGEGDMQAVSASLRYFSLGRIDITDEGGIPLYDIAPYEMSVDFGYSRKLSEKFSGSVVMRLIYSDMQVEELSAGTAFAADIAGYYTTPITLDNGIESTLSIGLNASNIGTKISYADGTSNFIPTNLRIGGSYNYPFDSYNAVSFNFDVNKYMVPTRPMQNDGEDDADFQLRIDDYNNMSPIKGIFSSFSDAPNGMKEELQEIGWSAGAEYNYNNQFFARGGYFYEHPNKGNRKYYSLGAGFKMNVFKLDVSYLISTAQSNPLDQTLRFSLSFDLDGLRSLTAR
ncbi:MAG: type IX secretion system outer membrane channel protein PorV [Bacteroidales bacterium]|nr:type IX secretion system outer membrane channel protein PorV [Bacteroidales bacterium]